MFIQFLITDKIPVSDQNNTRARLALLFSEKAKIVGLEILNASEKTDLKKILTYFLEI